MCYANHHNIILLIPCTDSYTLQIKELLAIVSFVMLMFAFELFDNNMIPSLILCMLFLVSGLGTPNEIFSSWANEIPWSMIGALILVGVMNGTNLLKRFAYGLMTRTGAKIRNILLIFMFAGIAFSTVLAANIGMPLAILAFGLCDALELKPKTNSAAKIMMGTYFAFTVGATVFLGPLTNMGAGVIAQQIEGFSISFSEYFKHNWLFIPYGFILVLLVNRLFKEDQPIAGKEVLQKEYKKLGKVSPKEIKLIILFIVLFICLFFSDQIGLSVGWMILIAAIICMLPFLKMGNSSALSEIRWPLVVFLTACLSIGTIASKVGAGDFIASIFLPLMSKVGQFGSLILMYWVGVIVNFVLTPLAAQGAMFVPLSTIGTSLGLSPNIVLYVFQNGVNQALLPYEIALAMFYYSFGLVSLKQFFKAGLIMLVTNFIWVFAVMVPYWHLIGI